MASLEMTRRRRLLSQRALAQRSGVSESTIYSIEGGKSTHPRLEVMRKLCDALGVEPMDVDEFRRVIESEQDRVAA